MVRQKPFQSRGFPHDIPGLDHRPPPPPHQPKLVLAKPNLLGSYNTGLDVRYETSSTRTDKCFEHVGIQGAGLEKLPCQVQQRLATSKNYGSGSRCGSLPDQA
jgi:hypothetical protein